MKMTFGPIRALLVTSLAFAAFGCNKVSRIESEAKQKTLYTIGGSASLPVKAFDSKGQPVEKPKLEWATADEKVVRVSPSGELTAVAAGQTIVTVQGGKAKTEIPVKVVPLASIKLSPESINLIGPVGSTAVIQPSLVDDKGGPVDEKVKWSSTAPTVATIEPDGVITAKGTGRTSVVATLEGVKAEAIVAVDIREIAKIVIHPETTILRVNEVQNFSATVFDQGTNSISNAAVSWTSSNPAVASVDLNGIVKAHARGTCQIDAAFAGKSAQSTVIVN